MAVHFEFSECAPASSRARGYAGTLGYKKKSVRLRLVYFNQDPLALPLFPLSPSHLSGFFPLELLRPRRLIKEKRKWRAELGWWRVLREGEREEEKKRGLTARAERAE